MPKIKATDDPTFQICKAFLHFERYGTIPVLYAVLLEETGFLTSKEHFFAPLSDPIILYEISKTGRQKSVGFHDLWVNYYMVQYNLGKGEIPDEYNSITASYYPWGLSLERLNKEREKGLFNQAVERCAIDLI